ncbi:glycoside hydrolase [Mycolicibacterium mengxianglii]|uniref:glycoside hydrolase n=1 Tax=Mycolicibacterium mengxianglii TaxID=2736649 RepID=UPI0035585DAB
MQSVGRQWFANGGGRWVAVAASLVVSAGMFYAQSSDPTCCTAPAAAPPAGQNARPDTPPAPEAELLAASAPAAGQRFEFALPAGVAPEGGLQIKSIWVARAIAVMFPEITTIGGYRQDPLKWHPNGLAIDVMIPNHDTDEGIELGNQIAGLALANAKRWGVLHVIWRQGLYPGVGAPSWTADYGNETANHFDHVHIATNGGGYPRGGETYFLDYVGRAD